ncbi:flagellar hook-length control protein FliK [Tropicimonas sp. S265A]|uniref:flagellar hook-length control protein FliK n=1 Tax=Tropicimonas sp. S265A TaxID=3415134 RepID=UPI003C7E4B27
MVHARAAETFEDTGAQEEGGEAFQNADQGSRSEQKTSIDKAAATEEGTIGPTRARGQLAGVESFYGGIQADPGGQSEAKQATDLSPASSSTEHSALASPKLPVAETDAQKPYSAQDLIGLVAPSTGPVSEEPVLTIPVTLGARAAETEQDEKLFHAGADKALGVATPDAPEMVPQLSSQARAVKTDHSRVAPQSIILVESSSEPEVSPVPPQAVAADLAQVRSGPEVGLRLGTEPDRRALMHVGKAETELALQAQLTADMQGTGRITQEISVQSAERDGRGIVRDLKGLPLDPVKPPSRSEAPQIQGPRTRAPQDLSGPSLVNTGQVSPSVGANSERDVQVPNPQSQPPSLDADEVGDPIRQKTATTDGAGTRPQLAPSATTVVASAVAHAISPDRDLTNLAAVSDADVGAILLDTERSNPRSLSQLQFAQPAQLTEQNARSVVAQIREVTVAADQRVTEVQLNPEELGRVRLTFSGGEAAQLIAIQIDRPETLDLVRRNLELLRQELAEAGYDMSNAALTSDGQSNDSQKDLTPSQSVIPAENDPELDPGGDPALLSRTRATALVEGRLDLRL